MGTKKQLVRPYLLIGFIGLLISCDRNVNETLVDFIITNESGVDIEVIALEPIGVGGFDKEQKARFVIEDNSTYSEKVLINERFSMCHCFSEFFQTNRVSFVFNGQRKITYICSVNSGDCSDSRNILKFSSDANNRAEYTFTISDFDSAEPCDGTCDD